MQRLDVLILAGGPPDTPDPLAAAEGVQRKVMIDLHGRPMLWWTLQALRGCDCLGRLIVLGGEPEDVVGIEGPIECLPVRGKLLDNILAGLRHLVALNSQADLALVVGGDTPLLTSEVVNWFMDACGAGEADLYYPVVERAVMEGRFPGSARTYVSLREGRFCGGDVLMVRVDVALTQSRLLRDLTERRKTPLQQARLIGLGTLIKLLLHRLGIAEAERVAGRALSVRGKVIICPHAELAMDVDKLHHLAIARQALADRLAEAV